MGFSKSVPLLLCVVVYVCMEWVYQSGVVCLMCAGITIWHTGGLTRGSSTLEESSGKIHWGCTHCHFISLCETWCTFCLSGYSFYLYPTLADCYYRYWPGYMTNVLFQVRETNLAMTIFLCLALMIHVSHLCDL